MKLNSPVSNLVVGYFGSMEIQQPDIILRAVHHVISWSWVGPTIVIAILRVDFHHPPGSKGEVGGNVIWADSLEYGWHGHLVERSLGVTCWFCVAKSKRSKWFSGNNGLRTESKELLLVLQKLVLRSCTKETWIYLNHHESKTSHHVEMEMHLWE